MPTYRILLSLVVLSFLITCQAKQDGALDGTIAPPSAGVKISALRGGNVQSEVDVNAQDGKFRMTLPAGTYDVRVSVPNSPYPMTFPAVAIEPGKTTTLPPIDLSMPSGHAVLSGRVLPVGNSTKVALYSEGTERASIIPDAEGHYTFTELPAGIYTIRSSATGYAQDTAEVNLLNVQSATLNMRLLYASAINGVDWNSGKIRAVGVGMTPANVVNATIGREMARRAALADAQRNLLNAINQIKIDPELNLKSLWGENKYTQTVNGFIQGYQVTGERELGGGKIEVSVELPLTGKSGLTRYLSE